MLFSNSKTYQFDKEKFFNNVEQSWDGKIYEDLKKNQSKKLSYNDSKVFSQELHHFHYGLPWHVGLDMYKYLINTSLISRNDCVLDIGCGSLRLGIHLARYLDTGKYFGIDSHLPSLVAGHEYEIPMNHLEQKNISLIHDSNFNWSIFGTKFKHFICHSVINHVKDGNLLAKMCNSIINTSADNCNLFIYPELPSMMLSLFEKEFRVLHLASQNVSPSYSNNSFIYNIYRLMRK